jgi:hypothetical protein
MGQPNPHWVQRPPAAQTFNVHQGAPADGTRKLLNLSGAALIWVITGTLLVCVGGPVALCLLCGLGGLLTGFGDGGDPSPSGY